MVLLGLMYGIPSAEVGGSLSEQDPPPREQIQPRPREPVAGVEADSRQGVSCQPEPSRQQIQSTSRDPAPDAKEDEQLGNSVVVHAWASRDTFQQLDPVEIHVELKNMSTTTLVLIPTSDVYRRFDVVVRRAGESAPRTSFAKLLRSGADRQPANQYPVYFPPIIRPGLQSGAMFPIKNKLDVNLLYDMTTPGDYEVTLELPVYTRDLAVKSVGRSAPVRVKIVERPY